MPSTTDLPGAISLLMQTAPPVSHAMPTVAPVFNITGNGNVISLGNLHMPGAVVALNDPAAVPRASGQ